jgi:hypothetical protein
MPPESKSKNPDIVETKSLSSDNNEKSSGASADFVDGSKKKVEDLEVKDAQLIFHSIWHELEQEGGG